MAEQALDGLKVEITEVQPCVKKLAIEIPEAAVTQKSEKALNDVRKKASVQGFRKGHVPKAILKRLYGKSVLHDISRQLINDGMDKALSDSKLNVLGQPSIEDVTIEEGKPISFTATVETMPTITLPDYTSWGFTRKVRKVDDKTIDSFIDHIREMRAEMVPAEERPIKNDDYIFLDFTGTLDGKELESLTGKNRQLQVTGDDKYVLAEFNRKLIGMKKGEEAEFDIKLPKHYPDPALAEKKVSFKVKINTIKEKKLPELTDEFVSTETSYKNVADFRAKIKESEEKRAVDESDAELRKNIMDKLIAETSFDLPPKMVTDYAQRYADEVIGESKRNGADITLQPNFDQEDFDKKCMVRGESRAREYVILEDLARREKIKPDEEKLTKRMTDFGEYMKKNKPNASKEEWQNGLNNISFTAFIDSVFDFLLSRVKINDKETKASDKEEKESSK